MQALTPSRNISTETFDSRVSINKLLRVFGIERCDVTLSSLHVSNGGVRQAELLSRFVPLPFELGGVVVVMTGQPAEADYQADHYGADNGG